MTRPGTDQACDDLYVIITGSVRESAANSGVKALKDFIMDEYGVTPGNLRYIFYEPGEPTAEFGSGNNQMIHPVRGRSFFKWSAFGTHGIMAIYLGHETPRLTAYFNSDWTPAPGGPTFGLSPATTDGHGNVQSA
ncbi:hypothetical protein RJ55_01534 [Drechmeria coniospora]|nr:hypothetical protein RJ55_01534 [Drechmeria coniospora]